LLREKKEELVQFRFLVSRQREDFLIAQRLDIVMHFGNRCKKLEL
jgi:hypothetical protein